MRTLCWLLLRLHPQAFRQRFGPEVEAILDEVPYPLALVPDLCWSLARQWTVRLRCALLIPALAALAAAVPLLAGAWLSHWPRATGALDARSPLGFFAVAALAALATIASTLVLAITWPRIRHAPRKRLRRC